MIREGYQQTAIGLIPCDWEVVKIKEVSQITTGSKNTQDKIEEGQYPFFVRSSNVEKINTYSFDGEAVLTAGDGVGTGKVFHYINGKFDFHQRVYKMSDFSENLNGYFFYLYFSNNFLTRIMAMTAKSSVDSVRMEMISEMLIPLPPLPEQKAIAEVLGDVDRLINACDKLIAKKRDIKQGAMQELLTGRSRLPGFSGEWGVKDIKEIVDNNRIPSGIYKEQKDYGNGTKIIKISDVFSNDFYIPELAQRVKLSYAEKSKYAVKTGDIIIALASVKLEGVGKVMLVKKLDEITTFDHNVALIRLKNDIESNYVFYILKSNLVRKIIASAATQVGTTFLKTSTILKFSIPLPPTLEEQKAIANILSDMDSEIEALEKKRDKYKLTKQGMMQELLTGKTRILRMKG